MVESLVKIQQLMAESRFVEAQKFLEVYFAQKKPEESIDLCMIYFECLESQQKIIPTEIIIPCINKIIDEDLEIAQKWLVLLNQADKKFQQTILNLEIRIAEKQGLNERLYFLIKNILQIRYLNFQTSIENYLIELIKKYFPNDFDIKLQLLAIKLLSQNIEVCEAEIKELIISCFEREERRGRTQKFQKILDVLEKAERLYQLDIYKTLLSLLTVGLKSKKDLKKIIEVVIYFEDVKFEVIVLNLMDQIDLREVAHSYAQVIRLNKNFKLLYISKYFTNLKVYFSEAKTKEEVVNSEVLEIDLELKETQEKLVSEEIHHVVSSDEKFIPHLVELQNYSIFQLLDLSISLYQSELYYASSEVAQLALKKSETNSDKLKSIYLKITSLLALGDYRSIIDESLEALKIVETQNDVLSFLYSMAEAYIRLNEKFNAKEILKKIIQIDDQYRLAKIKLEELDAL